MPFPLDLEFKKLTQQWKSQAPDEAKDLYAMTAFVNSAVAKVIIPTLKKAQAPRRAA